MAGIPISDDDAPPVVSTPALVYRHRGWVRLWHWINAATLVVMLMSGLMIFNAHPRLYWGRYGANFDSAWLQIGPTRTGGHVVIANAIDIPTGGVLGRWHDRQGNERTNAFPWWATIPSGYNLAAARRWHLSFAWVLGAGILLYLARGLASRHIPRDIVPRRAELRPAHVWQDIADHVRLRFPTGEAAARYNVLQKLAYASVVLVAIPLMVLTGLTMSPNFDANFPWLLLAFGGRQSARSLHFIAAFALVGFTVVHLSMVVLAGPVNEVRSMVTGWFRLPRERLP